LGCTRNRLLQWAALRFRAAILSAHIDLGRAKRGLFLFFLFAFFVNGALIAPFLGLGRGVGIACALIAAGGWVAALVDALRLTANREKVGVSKKEPPH
jgi:hypothetical protein